MRAPALLSLLIFLPLTAAAQPAVDDQSFRRYPSPLRYDGQPKFPDFRGRDQRFVSYRTRIRNGVLEGPNFAGKYSIVTFGCGSSCLMGYMTDLQSGQVYDLPFGGEDMPSLTAHYRINSRLVVAIWHDTTTCWRQDFVWAGYFASQGARRLGPAEACYGTEGKVDSPAPLESSTDQYWSPSLRSSAAAQGSQPAPPVPASPQPGPTPETSSPADQQRLLISAVEAARTSYASGANEMAKGAARPTRAKAICSSLPGPAVQGWTGRVTTLSSNSDGFGVLAVSLDKDVYVKTWNNSLSDIQDNTLIKPGTKIFNQAVSLSVGQSVRFSGAFVPNSVDCFKEGSLSLAGSIKSPEFIFRFSEISPN